MSYDEHDAQVDAFYEQLAHELYSAQQEQAIEEFTAERLRSFYVTHPAVMRPAVDALQEGKALLAGQRHSAALVFFVSAVELLLKATLLKPVVYGLIHHEALADVVVQHALGQTGFDRYEGLLADLFAQLASIDLKDVARDGAGTNLLSEAKKLQAMRNRIIHQGTRCSSSEAEEAHAVAVATYDLIVFPMLASIGLAVGDRGAIRVADS